VTVVRTLRKRRRILDLSQRELAARAGIGEKHLGEIERGLRDPRLSTLLRLLDALDLAPDEAAAFWMEAVGFRPSHPVR
jgi:predicted transcriptional regulator